MTEENPIPPAPAVPPVDPPVAPAASPYGAVAAPTGGPPAYSGATPYGGAGPVKKALSLTSFIVGIASVFLFALNWVAAVIGVVAVVLGFIGRSREPGAPRWMWLTGIILGFVGIVIGIIVLLLVLALTSYLRQNGRLNG